jgi:hypothetical protein
MVVHPQRTERSGVGGETGVAQLSPHPMGGAELHIDDRHDAARSPTSITHAM